MAATAALKLSLESPYKDDSGNPIPVVLDILPDGSHVFEPQVSAGAKLGDNLRRLFLERGLDFFEQDTDRRRNKSTTSDTIGTTVDADGLLAKEDRDSKPMTFEELLKMRTELLPQLHIALGEMSLARDVLSLFLSSSAPNPSSSDSHTPAETLASSAVSKPPAIPSVQSFNAHLAVGGKDEALRKAAGLFKSAAQSVDRGCEMADRYWMDALKIRRRNWGLVPAPLPYGAPTGRGADKTTRDFLICFGLEDSPAAFRRRALGHLASYETASGPVVFPGRSRTTLRVSLRSLSAAGSEEVSYNQFHDSDNGSLDGILRAAQRELIEQEIFTVLIRDAGNLPTTTARVSERLIVIEIAPGTELYLELVDSDTLPSPGQNTVHSVGQTKCDMIYHLLHILLLRLHSHIKEQRLSVGDGPKVDPASAPVSPTVLQPVIDILQYEIFCQRVKAEMGKIVSALTKAGVPIRFEFNAVGETGEEVVRLIREGGTNHIGGETSIRIDNSRTLRFTFHSPSSLIAHISQATLSISSITQLVQLLRDETEKCLLQRICDVGNQVTEQLNGVWFVDLLVSRSIGKWEGCVINFRISFDSDSTVSCTVSRLIRSEKHSKTYTDTFMSGRVALFEWIRDLIQKTIVP